MPKILRLLPFVLLGLAFSAHLSAVESAPIEAFLASPEFRLPKLSPDGLAYGVVGQRNGYDFLAIITFSPAQATEVATFANMKLVNYWWKSGGTVLMLIENQFGSRFFRAFNLQTKKTHELDATNSKETSVVNPLAEEPENILLSAHVDDGVDLRKLNINTAKTVVMQPSVAGLERWLTDRNGRPVAGYGKEKDHWFMIFPATTDAKWRRVDLGEKLQPAFLPIAVHADQRRIMGFDFVSADTVGIALWDPANDTKENVWQSTSVDASSSLSWGDDKSHIRAIVYEDERPACHYFEAKDRQLAAQIDASLPDTVNTVVSTSTDESLMIIRAASDKVPESYFLLDLRKGRLAPLGSARPQLDPGKIAATRHFSFVARDKWKIHGRLYPPPGTGSAPPTIILAGADPHARSWFSFQPYIQLLASRGYAVVEIDHRGVQGYGKKFAAAGDRQIDGAMGDDLVDGVRWLAQEGLIDPHRVAILGQDAGGYLALNTLIRYPGVFTLWINFGTPMDKEALVFNDVLFGGYTEKEALALLGGEKQAHAYLQTLDPVPLLKQVQVPSFHYYLRGDYSDNPANHGERVEKHLDKTDLPHVFLLDASANYYRNHDHTFEEKQRMQLARLYGELLTFLDRHLRPVKAP